MDLLDGCDGVLDDSSGIIILRPSLSLPVAFLSSALILCVLPCLISKTCSINVLLYGTSFARFRMTSPKNFWAVVSSLLPSSHIVTSS